MGIEPSPAPLTRIRCSARAPRVALMAACAVLCALGLRSLASHPEARPALTLTAGLGGNLRAQAVAEALARAYLSWDPRRPAARLNAIGRVAPGLAASESGDAPPAPRQGQRVL